MRTSKWFVLLGCALLLELVCSAQADACRHHRRCAPSCVTSQACDSCSSPHVPCWARCIDVSALRGEALHAKCSELGMVCWCCYNGVWTPCQGPNEDCPGLKFCFARGFNPQEMGLFCPQTRTALAGAVPDTRRCAMVCDQCRHCWRFAYPWETPLGMLSLDYLGTTCNPPPVIAPVK